MLELFELLLVEWIGNVLTVCIMYTLSLVFFDKVDWMTDRVAVLEGSYRVMHELESMLRWIKGKNCKLKNNLFAVNANVLFLLFWTMLTILNNAHNQRSDAQLFTWQLNGCETVENIKIHYTKLHGSTFFVRTKCFGKKTQLMNSNWTTVWFAFNSEPKRWTCLELNFMIIPCSMMTAYLIQQMRCLLGPSDKLTYCLVLKYN